MGALAPKDPSKVMVIRQIIPSITTLSLPFSRFGRVKIGGRATLVKLQSGAVAVFSPAALTDEVKQTVSSLGEVKYIAAVDLEHHIFIGDWHKAYPNAKVLGPEGLAEKRKKQGNEDVPITYTFTETKRSFSIDPEFDAEFSTEYVPAHANKEIVFLHKPTKTLIQGDLLFNLPATEQYSKSPEDVDSGILTRIFAAINNTNGNAIAQRRLIWWGLSSGNRPDFNKSINNISAWDFDRIIPCHGDVIETGGKGIFERVFDWHLAAFKEQNKSQ